MLRILALVVLLAGCVSASPDVGTSALLPSMLNKQRAEHDGQTVLVRGYLVHEPEAYAIWDSREAMENGDASRCISLLYPANLRDRLIRANRRSVLLRGVFRKNIANKRSVFLGLCNFTAISATEVL